MATVQTLVSDALGEIGVRSTEEPVNYEDSALALRMLNRMVDQWAAERLTIFSIVRTVANIGNSIGDYEIGSAATPTVQYAPTATEDWDSTWAGAPPGWTVTTTGTGTVTNDTGTYQAGGHSILVNGGAGGTASAYKDYAAFSGKSSSLSIYYLCNGAPAVAGMIVQCVETGHYLTSAGAWQAASTYAISNSLHASFFQTTLSFTTEAAALVGSDTCTLRVTLDHQDTPGVFWDTLSLSQTLTNVITPTIQIPRPLYIETVNLLNTNVSPTLETPLNKLDAAGWSRVPLKDQTSTYPTDWHYMPGLPTPTFSRNPTFPFGILHLWPVPTGSGLQIAIYAATQITQFAGLASAISLPPGYEEFIVTNLAVRLCEPFERVPKPSLIARAKEARAIVKRSNAPGAQTDMSFDAAVLFGNRGAYDITQG